MNVTAQLSPDQNAGGVQGRQIGENVSRKDKINFLVNTLLDIKDSKEAVYGALDAWVAWEQNFPIASLKRALLVLEKDSNGIGLFRIYGGVDYSGSHFFSMSPAHDYVAGSYLGFTRTSRFLSWISSSCHTH
nr:isoform 3 of pentatricopeptide repeat-containing protein, chloroplastic [Quercus suber]